jgi:hypothetical protein
VRTTIQDSIDDFPQPIVREIIKKQKKIYPENCILLVLVLGEYTGEDDALVHAWLKEVRTQTSRGSFAKIFLVEMARHKLFQIF